VPLAADDCFKMLRYRDVERSRTVSFCTQGEAVNVTSAAVKDARSDLAAKIEPKR